MVSALTNFLAHPPYRMAFMSLISLGIWLSFIFFYRFIYPKKKIPYLFLLLGFSLLPLVSVLREGSYESGDFNIHVINMMSFYKSLQQGILIPRWAGDLNASYGYPAFSFIYPLPYYISSFFHFLGFSFVNSVKALIITTYIASGLGVFLWLKNHVEEKYAFLGAIAYLFAPYHLLDMHFRTAIGEITAIAIIPICLYLIDKSNERKSFIYIFITGVSIALLIISHPAVSLIGLPLLVSYAAFLKRDSVKSMLSSLKPHILGLLLSCYYWVPVIFEGKYTKQMVQIERTVEFPTLSELLFSKWRYGFLYQGPSGQLTYSIGYMHILAVILITFFILSRRKLDKILYFLYFVLLIYLFFVQSTSALVWSHLSILRKMQFPYRLLSVIMLLTSSLVAYSAKYMKHIKFISKSLVIGIFSFLIILPTILNWGNRRTLPHLTDTRLQEELPYAKFARIYAAIPIWVPDDESWQEEIPEKSIKAVNGNIEILKERKSINSHNYIIRANNPASLKESTYYFPGWTLFIDGKVQPINFQNKSFPGIISFSIPPGEHEINLVFKDTPTRKYASATSLVTFLLSGMILAFTPLLKRIGVFFLRIKNP
jgi:hypothetical protein